MKFKTPSKPMVTVVYYASNKHPKHSLDFVNPLVANCKEAFSIVSNFVQQRITKQALYTRYVGKHLEVLKLRTLKLVGNRLTNKSGDFFQQGRNNYSSLIDQISLL